MLRRCIVKDLASLERGLHEYLRPVGLLYLHQQYRGGGPLTSEDKQLLRSVLAYYPSRRLNRERRERLAQSQHSAPYQTQV